ncbi:hypothetical protein HOY34_16835 [Xinfangfangia sp. D13-10-4-6]|uniref:hypothetical protein n=1 Tax=Pseudogemmobacter hezensis TaxID=2737662 RepID=UPI001558204C|nr:hypothetical protein [Pseudogemmobacter hezensis]NPD16861.1 hypothetical protein [Pseudogemmobacter hezensis]
MAHKHPAITAFCGVNQQATAMRIGGIAGWSDDGWQTFTRKRGRLASIPVTPRLGGLIDAMPQGQTHLIINKAGAPYSHENYLGDAVSEWRDKLGMRKELRLYDARGTAATRLLAAGAELKEIAVAMGWSIKHAAEVIENYVALSPQMADGIGDKLALLRSRAGTKL